MEKEKKTPTVALVEKFLSETYDLLRNEITQQIESKLKSETEYAPVNENSVHRALLHAGFKYSLQDVRSLLHSDFVESYNPFLTHFESLEPWDEKTDHITQLANHVKADDQEFFNTQFKKALVRCLACSLGGIPNRIVVVFISKHQEIGKSWLIRWLCPFPDLRYYSESGITGDKDAMLTYTNHFIINLEELADLSLTDVNALKARISLKTITLRRVYAPESESLKRVCNFWGSTNREEFLIDESHSRWLCISISDIDKTYSQTIDINQVWSQAYFLYRQGFDYNLNETEREQRDAINKQFEVSYSEKDAVSSNLQPANERTPGAVFFSRQEICDFIHGNMAIQYYTTGVLASNPIKLKPFLVTKALSELGFQKLIRRNKNRVQNRGYWVLPSVIKPEGPHDGYVQTETKEKEKPKEKKYKDPIDEPGFAHGVNMDEIFNSLDKL
jgi:hypothetical protein